MDGTEEVSKVYLLLDDENPSGGIKVDLMEVGDRRDGMAVVVLGSTGDLRAVLHDEAQRPNDETF